MQSSASAGIRLKHVAVLFGVGILWGLQPPLIKLLTNGGAPEAPTLGALLACTALILGAILAARGRIITGIRQKLPFMAINGATEFAIPLMLAFVISKHIDAGLLTLIFATTPIFTVTLAALSGTEPMTRPSLAACGMGVLAILALIVPQDALPSPSMLPWCLLAFAIPLSYATGSVYVSHNWPSDMDTAGVAFSGALVASILLAPFWVGPVFRGELFEASPRGLIYFLALLASTMCEMSLYYYLLRHAGAVFTSFSSFVMIVSGFAAGAVLFGEAPSAWVWLSTGLFVLSLAMIFLKPAPNSSR